MDRRLLADVLYQWVSGLLASALQLSGDINMRALTGGRRGGEKSMEQDLYAAGYKAGLAEAHKVKLSERPAGDVRTVAGDAAVQRRYELRDAYDNGYQRAKLEVSDILAEVSNFLDNYTDAEYDSDGHIRGNRAMNLKASIDELIG